MIAALEKDTAAKIELMRSLDPQSLKDMMIMDTQKLQTSDNMMFWVFRGVFVDDLGLYPSVASECKYRKNDSCGFLIIMIIGAPVLFTLSVGIDLATLPFTFIASAITGF